MRRLVAWLSSPVAAQVAVGVLIVIVIRSIGEFFRLGGSAGAPLTGEQFFYVEGALAAACAALIALALHAFQRHAAAVGFTAAAIVCLIVWKAAVLY